MQRRTFKPRSSTSQVNVEKIYTKGQDSFEIDVNDIKATLVKLTPHCDTLVSEAPAEFNEMVNTINVLCNTEYYPVLLSVISEYFTPEDVKPGTVKAYMVGCAANSDPCSSVCAGSAPPDSNFQLCSQKVIIGKQGQGGKYSFVKTHSPEGNRAIVYVPHDCLEHFPGFCAEEIKNLSSLGVTEVRLVGLNDVLLSDYAPLDRYVAREREAVAVAATRPSTGPVPVVQERPVVVNQSNSFSNSWLFWVIIVLVILGILFYFFYMKRKS
ncbi:Transmembrane domain-containing protein [Brazilian cedratvirus IHUMI]|uniref:Transmembrane domain-containing protein n=1 Tax=Brazilian cedratvirus IHUMI TaxID=2126980 RepID=A0A2R8FEE6_9VIRU|nr:Transmembrane domain-containing protein [Brazilian cedratvirus IHUMI]